jgi:hypothetical protein
MRMVGMEKKRLGTQGEVVVATITSLGYFGTIYLFTTLCYWLNFAIGLCCSISLAVFGLGIIYLGYEFIREGRPDPDQSGSRWMLAGLERLTGHPIVLDDTREFENAYFIPVVTMFLACWSSFAYGVARLAPGAYAHPEQLTYWLMVKHYLWQMGDMIPLVDMWKHIHIEDPVLEMRIWPGILVIVFRAVILFFVLAAAAKVFGLENRKTGGE